MNISKELNKDAVAEATSLQPWHKSAPWLISVATILGLIIVLQR